MQLTRPDQLSPVTLQVVYQEVSEEIDRLTELQDKGARVSRELDRLYRWLDKANEVRNEKS